METKLINLNSQYGTQLNGTYLSNMLFNTRGILKDEIDISYCNISLLNAQIPVSFYVVNSSNNVLNYQISSTNFNITITQGNYNGTTLITVMQALFLANGHTFSITLNSNTGIFTFTYIGTFTFLVSSTCTTILGFNATITSTTNSIVLPYPCNLLGAMKLNIVSNKLPTSNYDYNTANMLQCISVNQPSYSVINWENQSSHSNILLVKTIDNIDIQFTDGSGNYINFNNIPWALTIKLDIYRGESRQTLNDFIQKQQESQNDSNNPDSQ